MLCTALLAVNDNRVQAFDVFWTAGTGNWTTGTNWDLGEVPEAFFEDVAIVTNVGTAQLSSPAPDVAGLILGLGAGETGSLQVLGGGSINFVASTGGTDGSVRVGESGTGVLEVQPGGSLTGTSLDSNPGSSIVLGGSGSPATLASTGNAFLGGDTTIVGGNHAFTVANTAFLESSGTYTVELTSSDATTLAAGNISLGGQFVARTGGLFTPSVGDSWRLFDAATIDGNFGSIDLAGLPAAATGATYRLRVASGGLGQVADLSYEAVGTLVIDTDSGVASLASPTGVGIDIVGYTIESAAGQLVPGAWLPLDNNPATPGWDVAGTPSANVLDELNAQGSLTLAATGRSVGAIYSPPTEFGVAPDISFAYAVAGNTALTDGLVEFTGSRAANNLLLTVDPTTGEAQLQNSSSFAISLLGYSILSASGSLQPADGDWQSLSDANVAGWEEATPTPLALSELNPNDSLAISPGQAFSLGQLFATAGERDLVLEFALAGEQAPRLGVVEYDTIVATPGVEGDYNGDGFVDTADYTVWRDNLGGTSLPNEGGVSPGIVDQADYLFWRSRFGASAAVGSLAVGVVPEPTTAWITCLAAAAGLIGFRRQRFVG
jgi:hypothetical protein